MFQSTHPRRVRPLAQLQDWSQRLFQSTHPRRVRPLPSNLQPHTSGFNPRTHVGCDTQATSIIFSIFCFNPRTHVGCDFDLSPLLLWSKEFQSTHPRRVRLNKLSSTWIEWCFNPRTHVGCDSTWKRRTRMILCFNPRTHVGCDQHRECSFTECKGFNPRTHVGCDTAAQGAIALFAGVSIHAPT